MIPKFCLVPFAFFSEEKARELLSESVRLEANEPVGFREVDSVGAMLVYALSSVGAEGDTPEIFALLSRVLSLSEYNKILASWHDGYLRLVVAQGKSLLFAQAFSAPDFTTAEYYLFLTMRQLQLNPEVSTVSFTTPLAPEEEMSLYRYFKAVEQL